MTLAEVEAAINNGSLPTYLPGGHIFGACGHLQVGVPTAFPLSWKAGDQVWCHVCEEEVLAEPRYPNGLVLDLKEED